VLSELIPLSGGLASKKDNALAVSGLLVWSTETQRFFQTIFPEAGALLIDYASNT
jgi:hypothetical protein